MIDLSHFIINHYPQIVQDRKVRVIGVVRIDVISSFCFALQASF